MTPDAVLAVLSWLGYIVMVLAAVWSCGVVIAMVVADLVTPDESDQ